MKDPRRTYEAYEELGRQLDALSEAHNRVQRTIMDMWQYPDEQGRPLPSPYDSSGLKLFHAIDELCRGVELEYRAEIEEEDVPPGKPATPPPFDRLEGGEG